MGGALLSDSYLTWNRFSGRCGSIWGMQTITIIRPPALALLAALVLAGCGSESSGGTSTGEGREERARDATLAYAKCMREHGVDMPDPTPGERGIGLVAPADAPQDRVDKADGACREHLEDLEPPKLTDEQEKELQEAALAHARCMRRHGIDMPDPTFGDSGRAQIRIGKGGVDVQDPDFKAADEACRRELPDRPGAVREEAP